MLYGIHFIQTCACLPPLSLQDSHSLELLETPQVAYLVVIPIYQDK